jgi:hypothetical protein
MQKVEEVGRIWVGVGWEDHQSMPVDYGRVEMDSEQMTGKH